MNFIAEKIEVFIDRDCLQEFYSSSSKVIISTHDQEVFSKNLNSDREITVYEFEYDRVLSKATVKTIEKEVNSNLDNLIEVKLAPNFCLGLFAFSKAGKEDLTELLNWWKYKNSGQLVPNLIELDISEDAAKLQKEFWQQMYVQRSKENNSIVQRLTTLQRQYLNLRKLHEEMQNAFSTVEDYLSQAKLPPIQLAFDTHITDKIVEPSKINNSNSLTLRQLLPLPSRGLAVIELHIARQYSKAVGHLKISLKACEDSTNLAVWKIPYNHLSSGWLGLDLPHIDLGRKRDVELIVEWQTQVGVAPSLSLTKKQPILESRVYNDNITLENSFAIRIWQGLPGTRKVTNPYLITIGEDEKRATSVGLSRRKSDRSNTRVIPNLPQMTLNTFKYLKKGWKLRPTPAPMAHLLLPCCPIAFLSTANQLTASIITDHSEAGIIEYAIAIIEPEIDPKTALDRDTALSFSDWIEVEPNVHRQITLDLPTSATQHCHIVIATRLVKGNPTDFAWSNWLNFHTAIAHTKIHKPQAIQPPKLDSAQTKLRDASLPSLQAKFAKVQLIAQENKIQVHPTQEGDTIAVVSNAIKPNITKVKSTVCTENEAASTIEYAIALIATDDDTLARLSIASPTSALGFSGWQKVAPNTPKIWN